ncbi:MAG: MFS transporter [Verrucomicrobia bacterium]|nr:MFS transporter [Verrucomicrobiota bacterium]
MDSSEHSRAERRLALIVATMASFFTPFLAAALNVALPVIGEELGMHAVALSWVATGFILATAVCLLPVGRLADMIGRKRVFVAGLALFTASAVGCALARSGWGLIAFRTLQGGASAMMFGTGVAILASIFPSGERGRVLGLNAATVYTGLSAGPFLGGLLTHHWGWRSIFVVSVPAGLATTAVAWRGLKGEWRGEVRGPFDVVGAAMYAAALVALTIGFVATRGMAALPWLAAGVALLGGFIVWERRVEAPLIDVRLLTENVVFGRSGLAALINYAATFAVAFLVSLYLQYIRGLDPRGAGLVLLTQSLTMAVVSPMAGRLSDRIEPRIVATEGMVIGVAGLAWLCFLDRETPMVVIVAVLFVLGVGFGLFSSPNTNAIMSAVDKRDYGVASAMVGTMRMVGQMLSMGIAAAVLAYFVGPTAITPALHGQLLKALRVAFGISAVLCALGVWASLSRGNLRKSRGGATGTLAGSA